MIIEKASTKKSWQKIIYKEKLTAEELSSGMLFLLFPSL